MLTSADDSLWHVTSESFAFPATSDPRFFDRYWFAAYSREGRAAVQLTVGAYRNMNVMDAGLVVVRGGTQHNLRASRSLGTEIVPACGPLSVEVVEPFQEFRLTSDDADGGELGALELTWRAIGPPELEARHFERVRYRVAEDYQRFNQIGVVDGWVEVGGERVEVDDWWGCRDHSWGVRPGVGVPEPRTGPPTSLADKGFAMGFLFFSTDRLAGHLHLARRSGDEPYITGVVRQRGSTVEHHIDALDLDVDLHEGTRRFTACRFTARAEDGTELTIEAKPLGAAFAMQGLGYSKGFRDGRGLGVWRGEEHLEQDTWDVSHPATIVDGDGGAKDHWHRIQPVTLAVVQDGAGDPQVGTGSLTLVLSGKLPEFGLD